MDPVDDYPGYGRGYPTPRANTYGVPSGHARSLSPLNDYPGYGRGYPAPRANTYGVPPGYAQSSYSGPGIADGLDPKNLFGNFIQEEQPDTSHQEEQPDTSYQEEQPDASHQENQPASTHPTISKDQTGDLQEVEKKLLSTISAQFHRALVQLDRVPNQAKLAQKRSRSRTQSQANPNPSLRGVNLGRKELPDSAERPSKNFASPHGLQFAPLPISTSVYNPQNSFAPSNPYPPSQRLSATRASYGLRGKARPAYAEDAEIDERAVPTLTGEIRKSLKPVKESRGFHLPYPHAPSDMSSLQQPMRYAAGTAERQEFREEKVPARPKKSPYIPPSGNETFSEDQRRDSHLELDKSRFGCHDSCLEEVHNLSDSDRENDCRPKMELSESEKEISDDYQNSFREYRQRPSQRMRNFGTGSGRLHSSVHSLDLEAIRMHSPGLAQPSFSSSWIGPKIKRKIESKGYTKQGSNHNLPDAKDRSERSKAAWRGRSSNILEVSEGSKTAASQTQHERKKYFKGNDYHSTRSGRERYDTSASLIATGTHQTKQVDWRSHLCNLLRTSTKVSDDILIDALEATTKKLEIAEKSGKIYLSLDPSARYHTIHRINCPLSRTKAMYLDLPEVSYSFTGHSHLQGHAEIDDLEVHIEPYKQLSFVVYKDYHCEDIPLQCPENVDTTEFIQGESVCIVNNQLYEGLTILKDRELEKIPSYYPKFGILEEFRAPYLWLFHQRVEFEAKRQQLPSRLLKHVNVFVDYINKSFGQEYAAVDMLLAQGHITSQYLSYLYVPNTVLFNDSSDRQGRSKAYLAESWLSGDVANLTTGSLTASSWSFDGVFQKNKETLSVKFPGDLSTELEIASLNIYPLQFADPKEEQSLRKQGETLWSCRQKRYVSYIKSEEGPADNGDSRYMIDMGIYKQLHPSTSTTAKVANRDDLEPDVMASDVPPSGFFTLLLPNTIIGFDMLEKKWVDLEVSRIREVKWNKMVFESLVLDPDTKKLIKALVTNQIAVEQSTDLMSGKGNGLIVLLHGGPGTGKTLTAESVAEIAEKPLYRVTCGDIGTNAEAVEKYLETVLYLGKVWRCVVLLDEADVFLERRTLADLQRNALVSVFLRVLEYYSGILVLTSNRVGTFDEAFKSRIQLSLRYENLTEKQRRTVWKNFIDRLETFESVPSPMLTTSTSKAMGTSMNDTPGVAINISELRAHLSDLAKHPMNGRQIRNALTTARQLALYEKKPMGYAELNHVIGVVGKFDEYLLDLNNGVDDDTMAKAEEIR